MWILFAALHFTMPDKVPLDYTVFLGGIGGGAVAVLNFFLMGLAVQKAASASDEGNCKNETQSQLFTAFFDADPVGDPGNRRTLLSLLLRVLLPLLFPGNGNQDRGDIS
ncbi:MAG: hypothetical protein ACLUS5_19280 [Roseburia faecis]